MRMTAQDGFFQPVSGLDLPRFAGVPTFMRLPQVGFDHPRLSEVQIGLIGVAVGPRVERRFGKGMTFFIDGQAEAQAVRGADAGWWSLPGSSTADLTMLGVTARTGLVR